MNITDTTGRTAARWVLDPDCSSAEFRVPNFWGLLKVKGRFERLDGWLEIDHGGDRRLELILDAASVNTGNRKRDEHLRSEKFFDAQRHPAVRFQSTSVSDKGDGRLHVEGELSVAGKRVPLTLEPTLQQSEDHLQIEASTRLDQRQLGMTSSPLGMTKTPTKLIVHAQLRHER